MPNNITPLCSGQEEQIYLFLDQALPPPERAEFAAHLETCPACQALLAETEALFAALAALEPLDPGPDRVSAAATAIMQRVAPPAPRSPARRLEQMILAGQMIAGLILAAAALPPLVTKYGPWLAWLLTLEGLAFDSLFAAWGAIFSVNWPDWDWQPLSSPVQVPALNLAPEIALTLGVAFGLAWLLSNRLLLGGQSHSLKNGGTS